MALGSRASKSDTSSSGNSHSADNKQGNKRSIGEIIDFAARTIVLVVGLPIRLAGAIVAQFVGNGGVGKAALGGLFFIGGSLISADSVWQLVFQGPPIFPWFEQNHSWTNILLAAFNPFFYIAFLLGVGIQVIEGRAIRGKNPDSARRELQDSMQYDLESKPTGKIDLTGVLWQSYKTAGVREEKSAGMTVFFVAALDFVTTFAARNPFQYTDPMVIIGCIAFNLATMAAGEMGYAVWRMTKD